MHDAHGQQVWAAELDSYGRVRQQEGEAACPFRYQGQYEDAETGLYYNRFRYYDPEAGQYVSQDPIGIKGGSALYGYVSNPTTWIDPFGLTERIYENAPYHGKTDNAVKSKAPLDGQAALDNSV
jgi:RHS repeat-associated protein